VDCQRLEDLNRSPYGRALHVLTHRLPRGCKAGRDWGLDRGFHLEVLDEDLFLFTLAGRDTPPLQGALPLLAGHNAEDQERFLIWHCPGRYSPEKLLAFADRLGRHPECQVGLILSHRCERAQAFLDFPKYRQVWRSVNKPVLQAFQDFPTNGFFTVEKNLFDLGRIGRRLVRFGRWRRLMPW
jgi:hypothetical protein